MFLHQLPVASKVMGRVIIERIQNGVDHVLRKEQAGFRKNKSTVDQIFILRNIIEQVNEWQATFYAHFVDFEKAFDSVHREGLWRIMKAYGIPDKLITMVKIMYDDFECSVLDEGEQTRWFKITTGVKQGCVMSGFLFLLKLLTGQCAEQQKTIEMASDGISQVHLKTSTLLTI